MTLSGIALCRKAVCEACFATSHRFVPDFLVSILPQPAIFFGTDSILLIKLLFMMHFVIVYSVMSFIGMSVCYHVKFWALLFRHAC